VDDTKPSKSARKREHLARQKLGEELITLREGDLRSLALDEDLFEAVMEARGIKSHGALRRQKQYIGKIMRHMDPEPIRAALENLHRK
jgi:ribosome-associated protein